MKKTRAPTKTNWANVLTWTRLALLVPVTVAAYYGLVWVVFWLIVLGALTDIFDGRVARWTGTASEAGARLDSQIDALAVPFLLVWLWLLYPLTYRDFAIPIMFTAVLFVSMLVTIRMKLGIVSGLHLWSNKLAALVMAALLPAFILFGYAPIFVWITLSVAAFSQIEGIVYVLSGGKNLDARWFGDD
jgi:CDP-diacylglycerol--glycerol-3-phosphate 3-phosphatidyltransferase